MDLFGREALRRAYETALAGRDEELRYLRKRLEDAEANLLQVNAKLAEILEPGVTRRMQQPAERKIPAKPPTYVYPLPGSELALDGEEVAYAPGIGIEG